MFNLNFLQKKNIDEEKSITIDGRNIKLLLCLGNPGEKYKQTYHNAGFLFADRIIAKIENDEGDKVAWKKIKSFTYVGLGSIILVKPTTFMNKSGIATKEALKYFNMEPSEMLVAQDDSDITLGEYKISLGRGSAGHNGIKSIIGSVGTDDFARLRIGVRTNEQKAGDFVLSNIKTADRDALIETIDTAVESILRQRTSM